MTENPEVAPVDSSPTTNEPGTGGRGGPADRTSGAVPTDRTSGGVPEVVDAIVVGGGIGGLTAAHRPAGRR